MKRLFVKEIVVLLVVALLVPVFSIAEDGSIKLSDDVDEMEEALALGDLEAVDMEGIEAEEYLSLDALSEEMSEGELEDSDAGSEADADTQFNEVENVSKKFGVPAKLTLGVKETYALKCTKKKLTYKTSSAKVAKVSKKGVITAVKKGKATITVYSNKKKLTTCKVTVVAAPKKVSLAVEQAELGLKESLAIIPIISDETHASFTYASKNEKIATVNAEGVVTARKAGSTAVTVKTHNGKKAILKLTVRKAPKTVALEPSTLEMEVGETASLSAILPEKTASFKLTWTSSKKSVATVDEYGVVTAAGSGTAKITVKTFNKKKAVCTVTVTEPKPTEAPTPEPTEMPADPTDGDESIDMFQYLFRDGVEAVKELGELGFKKRKESLVQVGYYKDGVEIFISKNDETGELEVVCGIYLEKALSKYNICGAYCGMTPGDAESVLNAAGWERYTDYDKDGDMNFVRKRSGREDWLIRIVVYYKDDKVYEIWLEKLGE